MPTPNQTPDSSYIGVIKLHDEQAPLLFGPFSSYRAADEFIQQKALEYARLKTAYVQPLYNPRLFPARRV